MVITSNFDSPSNGPSSTNEIYQIKDDLGNVIDEVNYDDDGITWPVDEDGVSIYLDKTTAQIQASGESDNNNGCNWSESKIGDDDAYVATDGHIGSPGIITVDNESGTIVITEILYNPVSPEAGQEWVEIANTTSSTVSLTGWTFADIEDGHVLSLSGSIAAFGVAIISNQGQSDFQGAWSGCTSNIQVITVSAGPSLSNSAKCATEKLQIRDNNGNLSDEVNYEASGNWPIAGSDASITLNLLINQIQTSGASLNNNGSNWILSTSDPNSCVNLTSGSFVAGSTGSPGSVSGSTFLPVELTFFDVRNKGNYNLLSWLTSSEFNNSGFELQKSKDGKDWKTIDFVNGMGTTKKISKYEYQDSNPYYGTNYYRLKQIDNDATFKYSKVIVINFSKETELYFFPNPVNDKLQIVGMEEGEIVILDCMGKTILQTTYQGSELDLSDLSGGIYFVKVSFEKKVWTRKIIKE